MVGGIPPASYVNVLKLIADAPGVGQLVNDFTKQLLPLDFRTLLRVIETATPSSKYAGELLITDADLKLRGPTLDQFSRSAVDVILRSAALVLKPCGQQQPPANLVLKPFDSERTSELSGKGDNGEAGPKAGGRLDSQVKDTLSGGQPLLEQYGGRP